MKTANTQSKIINEFFVEWSALNHYMSSYECERAEVPYIGFKDPRVQKLWKKLKNREQRELMKRCCVKTEEELSDYLG